MRNYSLIVFALISFNACCDFPEVPQEDASSTTTPDLVSDDQGEDQAQIESDLKSDKEDDSPKLDYECQSGKWDYVVRSIYPTTPEDSYLEVYLDYPSNYLQDVDLLEYEVHACTSFILNGGALWFDSYGVFDEEEHAGDAQDPTGIIMGVSESGNWLTRFYGFKLRIDGEIVGELDEMLEMSVSDTNGSAQWSNFTYEMKPGDVLTFKFSASVRAENPPSDDYGFVLTYFPIVDGMPDPNPHDRIHPWGLKITYPQLLYIRP